MNRFHCHRAQELNEIGAHRTPHTAHRTPHTAHRTQHTARARVCVCV
jgi:hypothetical protein